MAAIAPDIAPAYALLRNSEQGFVVIGYDTDRKDHLVLRATGTGVEELRDLYSARRNEIMFGVIREGGRELVYTLIPSSTSGVKRAKALVHSRSVAAVFPHHQATKTYERAEDITLSSIRIKLKLEFLLPEPSALDHPASRQIRRTPSDYNLRNAVEGDARPPLPEKTPSRPSLLDISPSASPRALSFPSPTLTAIPVPPVSPSTTSGFVGPPSSVSTPSLTPTTLNVETMSSSNSSSLLQPQHFQLQSLQHQQQHHQHHLQQQSRRERTSSRPTSADIPPLAPALTLRPNGTTEYPRSSSLVALSSLSPTVSSSPRAAPSESSPRIGVVSEELDREAAEQLQAEREEALREEERERCEEREVKQARVLKEEQEKERLRIAEAEHARQRESARKAEEMEKIRIAEEAEMAQKAAAEKRAAEIVLMKQSFEELRSSGSVILSGSVMAQGGDSIIWKRRRFELTATTLTFFSTIKDSMPVDLLDLWQLRSIEEEPTIRHSLRLRTGSDEDEAMSLYCDTAVEKESLEIALRIAKRA